MVRASQISLAGITALLSACMCIACAPKSAEVRADGGQVLELTDDMLSRGASDTLRFGRLHAGETAVKTLHLRNLASEPLVIVRHEVSCMCVEAEYPRRPLLPDEEADITCSVDTRGEYGLLFKLVKLRLAGRDEPLKIFVEATIEK